jgi:hypothetical protein
MWQGSPAFAVWHVPPASPSSPVASRMLLLKLLPKLLPKLPSKLDGC